MRLHQLLALLPSIKKAASKLQTELYQSNQKAPLFNGLSKTYEPREEEGFIYPPESIAIQLDAGNCLKQYAAACKELWDTAAAQDCSNVVAKASIVVGSKVIIADIPVTYLLFLEKQLGDLKTFIGSIPTLDLDKSWEFDGARNCYATPAKVTVKTKKLAKAVVLYEATKEHPAQVKEAFEDVVEGSWTTITTSSALPREHALIYLARVEELLQAVIVAREDANSIAIIENKVAESMFNFIFGA